MPTSKKYLYDKTILFLASLLVFVALITIFAILLRLGSGQGISDYYIEYRQGPTHSIRGDFGPTGSVWSMLNFVWFTLVTVAFGFVLSVRTYKLKREVAVTVLALSIILLIITCVISNVLLGHR